MESVARGDLDGEDLIVQQDDQQDRGTPGSVAELRARLRARFDASVRERFAGLDADALAGLDADERAVVHARHAGASFDLISVELGVPTDTAETMYGGALCTLLQAVRTKRGEPLVRWSEEERSILRVLAGDGDGPRVAAPPAGDRLERDGLDLLALQEALSTALDGAPPFPLIVAPATPVEDERAAARGAGRRRRRTRADGPTLWPFAVGALLLVSVGVGIIAATLRDGSSPGTGAMPFEDDAAVPQGESASFYPFEIGGAFATGWKLGIEVFSGADRILSSGMLDEARWVPTPAEQSLLDERRAIRWEFRVLDERGEPMRTGTIEAWRN